MRKDQQEELRRLEQALLEADAQDASAGEEDSDAWLEEIFQEFDEEYAPDYDVYNADTADVDLDRYSQEVLDVPKKKGCGPVVFVFLLLLLGALTLWILKKWGIL